MGCCSSATVLPFDLKEIFQEQDGLDFVTMDKKDMKQTMLRVDPYVETTVLSYCGTNLREPGPVFDWMLGPEIQVIKRNDADSWAAEANDKEYLSKLETRRKALDRVMAASLVSVSVLPPHGGFVVAKAEGGARIHGNVLAVQTTNDTYTKLRGTGTTGHSIPAAHVAVRFYPDGYKKDPLSLLLKQMNILKSAPEEVGGKNRIAADYAMMTKVKAGKDCWSRMILVENVLSPAKKRLMQNTPFIHVGLVSVAPEAQGQGLCSRLMRGINAVADKLGWACYLETGSKRLESVYERYGYKTVHTEAMSAKCDNGTDWPDITMRFMIRPATATGE